jgi:nitrite reductase/ring-hydroxylating ferredoxin subunit
MKTKIASTKDIPPGTMTGVVSQNQSILLTNIDGKYYAIGDICTHQGCSLSDGNLDGEKVQCPCHGSIFNVKTGQVVQRPAKDNEPIYKVTVEGEEVILVI